MKEKFSTVKIDSLVSSQDSKLIDLSLTILVIMHLREVNGKGSSQKKNNMLYLYKNENQKS